MIPHETKKVKSRLYRTEAIRKAEYEDDVQILLNKPDPADILFPSFDSLKLNPLFKKIIFSHFCCVNFHPPAKF